MKTKLFRFVIVLTALAVLAFSLPQSVFAQSSTPSVEIVSVTADESVVLRGRNFPANATITIRMDVSGNAAQDGIVVAESNSGSTGSFEGTYRIPVELRGKSTITVRMESSVGGWFAYNWFTNRTTSPAVTVTPGSVVSTPVATSGVGRGPNIKIVGVEQNRRITVLAAGFPANTNFNIRIGPFYNFWRGGVVVGTINSGSGGTFEFTVNLPSEVTDVELVSVRLDSFGSSTKYYAYNAFTNTNLTRVTGTPQVTGTPAVVNIQCSVTSTQPVRTQALRADFDAVWTVKNTGNTTWLATGVDYKYVSGTHLEKRASAFDLPKDVKPGESIEIRVDMTAPATAGTYATNWALMSGSTTICRLPLGIAVR